MQDGLPDSVFSPGQKGSVQLVDDDGDSTMDSGEESDDTTTGTASSAQPIPGTKNTSAHESKTPFFTSIGSPAVPSHKELLPLNSKIADDSPQKQLKSDPQGDEASPAVRAEGLMDTSEDPLKL